MDRPLDFIRDHLSKRGITVPPTLPQTDINRDPCVRVRRSMVSLLITESDDILGVSLDIELCDEGEGEPSGLGMRCWQGSDSLRWDVVVHPSTPKHFSHFRGHFLPHGPDSTFGVDLPHEEGVKWLDRLVTDFLSYSTR